MKWAAIITQLAAVLMAAMLMAVLGGCTPERKVAAESYALPDTLVVGTLSSPTSFFIYRGDTLGYDHDRVMELAADKGISVQFKTARSMQQLMRMLDERQVHLVACAVPLDDEHNSQALHCGETTTVSQVLVQPKGRRRVRRVEQLAGREVWVEQGTKYEATLQELNRTLGGRITVHAVSPDSLNADELVAMVSEGKIGLTVIDGNIAKVDRGYSPNIDISLEIGFPQRNSWAVNNADDWLADSIDAWATSKRTLIAADDITVRYFEQSRSARHGGSSGRNSYTSATGRHYTRRAGDVSAFDSLFRACAPITPYDWRFLAAIAQAESDFNPSELSWAGARGLMQIMPSTARGMGVNPDQLMDPEVNVRTAARLLRQLDGQMTQYATDPTERRRFVLAAYNAGAGHIADAVRLAEKYGLNPRVWYGNVEQALQWKSMQKYYNDPICRYGYMRSDETVNYVRRVEHYYSSF